MAHFTGQDQLKAFLNSDQVIQLFSKIPEAEKERQFLYADALIKAKTGVSPIDPVGNNSPILTSIASRLVIWYLSGQQQWNESNKPELDRREKLYDDAIAELDAVAEGDISLSPPEETTSSAFGAAERRMEDW